jgi:protein TonB
MLISVKDLLILTGVIALHIMLLFFSILHTSEPEMKDPPVLQAQLVSPPAPPPAPPAAKAPPPPPAPVRKPPPQLLTVAPAQKLSPAKAQEPSKDTPKPPAAAPSSSVNEAPSAASESTKSEATSSSNNSKSSASTGIDAGPVELNQLIMVYRPDTEVFYPRLSKDIGEQGVVGVRLFINENGEVKTVTVVQSSGYERLDKAALQLASRIRFKPYLINGIPSRVNAGISIKFQLNR